MEVQPNEHRFHVVGEVEECGEVGGARVELRLQALSAGRAGKRRERGDRDEGDGSEREHASRLREVSRISPAAAVRPWPCLRSLAAVPEVAAAGEGQDDEERIDCGEVDHV